ncbi:MAG: enoyl-CoA hydratase/isomerase family protein [Deltaproteobacteria bacterium]|nr:enoyl-CoA hydratase/isomerase family protein [Deltaproteobacteria bacterium]
MSGKTVRVSEDGPIMTIHLNRPERMNALTDEMLDELEGVISHLGDHLDRTRVVIFKGEGKAFCAGVEMKGVTYNPLNARTFLLKLNRVINAVEMLPQPTISAIHGACVAGGLELTLATTFRVAAVQSKIGLPEAGLGLVAAGGTSFRLPRLVGYGKALELTLMGEIIDGKEAERIGLVNKAVDEKELDNVVNEMAQKLLKRAPLAMNFVKEAFCLNASPHRETSTMLEILGASVNHYTKDKLEGLQAFFEKRPPEFKGE